MIGRFLKTIWRPRIAGGLLAAVSLSAGSTPALGQDWPAGLPPGFPVSAIPSLYLDEEAGAVVRADVHHFEAEGPGSAVYTVRRAVTVLDVRGRDYAKLVLGYDRLRPLRRLDGQLRDANGKVIRRLKRDDVQDFSAISNFSLYDDNRVKVAELYADNYPYTVEWSYEWTFDGIIGIPSWRPVATEAPVEYSQFEVVTPADLAVRHKAVDLDGTPEIRRAGEQVSYRWTYRLSNSEGGVETLPEGAAVHLAADRFEIERTEGDMSTWQGFGAWYAGLSLGRDALPPELRAEVARRVADVPDPLERARRIYTFHQETTRYVSVQLGIGGWQPFDAAYVFTNKYGDCKALTNYLAAMLREVGIEAAPALIRHGRNVPDVFPDFPSAQFNHVLVRAVAGADTVWLEATDPTAPFGLIGTGNEDRYALLVDGPRSRLVRTPMTPSIANTRIHVGTIEVDAEGHARASLRTSYAGLSQQAVRLALFQEPYRERMNWLRESINIPRFDVVAVDFADVDRREPILTLPVELDMPRYASRSGTRLFLRPNVMGRTTSLPPEDVPAEEYTLPFAHLDVDTLRYRLPSGYAVEAIPEPLALTHPFGSFHAEIEVEAGGVMIYTRRLEMTRRRISIEEYTAYRAFAEAVARSDDGMVVLVKRGS